VVRRHATRPLRDASACACVCVHVHVHVHVHMYVYAVHVLAWGSEVAISSFSFLRASSGEPAIVPFVSTLRWARTWVTYGCSPDAWVA
jgi:hypothetical protein